MVLNDALKRLFDALMRFLVAKGCFNEIFGIKRYLNEIFLLKQYSNKMKLLKVHLQLFSSVNLIHFLEWNGEGLARSVWT
jgi:hypothetical protein